MNNFWFPTCSSIFLASGNKWSAKHELWLSWERHNVLPSWWLWENHSHWANHHKVSPVVWMYTVTHTQTDIHDAWWRKPLVYVISILKDFPLKILLFLSVLKLVGDLGSDVQSRVVKDFSMVTHRNSNVRAVLFSSSRYTSCIFVFLWSFESILFPVVYVCCSQPNKSPSPHQAARWRGDFISWMMTQTKRCCSWPSLLEFSCFLV